MYMNIASLDLPTAKVNQLNKKGIETTKNLLMLFPRKYHDFRTPVAYDKTEDGQICSVIGHIKELKNFGKMLRAKIIDERGKTMQVIWFNQPFIMKMLRIDTTYMFCGKISHNTEFNVVQMASPFFFSIDLKQYRQIMPVYPKIKGMSDDYLLKLLQTALVVEHKKDPIESSVVKKFGLMRSTDAFKGIHQPKSLDDISQAQERFLFDDLFEFAMQMQATEELANKHSAYKMPKSEMIQTFVKTLPFTLTDGQRDALNTIYLKMRKGDRVHALVQGDVGCGKTIVATTLMMIASENGYQSAMIAPTNVLAKQHYEDLKDKAEKLGFEVVFLSGDMKAKEKRLALKKIESGEAHMVVGTHAILSKDVQFKSLAVTIVDEEHRFGVVQRNQLREKAMQGVHHVSMSATPIPRTMAMTMYGEGVDVLTIKTLPKGRQPIKTVILTDEVEVWEGLYRQVREGRQCYVVCPLIEESDSELLEGVDSVEETYAKMTAHFQNRPEIKISMVSGKMKQDEVNEEIARFTRNEVQILISTTIIEVGVNVPNATVIAIKNAERFGLAQLHQLRGRVGRGNHASFCVLLSKKKDNPKLIVLRETTDGFRIAEADLQLRGTGDLIGTKQTGDNKYVMQMLANPDLYEKIKEEVRAIWLSKERLSHYRFVDLLDVCDEVS